MSGDVRFTLKSGYRLGAVGCPLCTKSGLRTSVRAAQSEPLREDGFPLLLAAKRFERCAHLGDEKLRLFPRRKMGALGETIVVDELGVSLLSPTLRCLVNLFGEGTYGNRNLDASRIEETSRQIVAGVPIEAR